MRIDVIAGPEHMQIEGNAIASGDDAFDKEVCDKLRDDLQWNEWAWCCIEVRVTMDNGIHASDYLGGCSYASKEDFIQSDGYYSDMVDNCLDQLVEMLGGVSKAVAEIHAKKLEMGLPGLITHDVNQCECPTCRSPEKGNMPLILAGSFDSDEGHEELVNVFWSKNGWLVVFKVTAADGSINHHNCTSLDWNVSCQAWRKDIKPDGIKGKGWRRNE